MLKRSLSFFILIGLISCAQNPKKDADRAQLHLQIGTSLFQQGQYPGAMAELLKAHELDPTNPIILNNLALAYVVRERYTLAEKHLQEALKLNPKYTEARNNLGRIYLDQSKNAAAVKELKIASNDLTYPVPAAPLGNLGEAYFKLKQYESARQTLEESLRYQRNNCHAMIYYGRSLLELKQLGPASKALDEAVRSCPGNAKEEPLYYASLSYIRLNRYEEAQARWQESLENFPQGKYAGIIRNMIRTEGRPATRTQ